MAEPAKPARRQQKIRTTPVVVEPPQTSPLSEADRRQAVTALSALIAEWWERQQADEPPARPSAEPPPH